MCEIKRLPYGVSDFVSIITRNRYYVDKTTYLAQLERETDTIIFIRPRRFGKSLFLSMMEAYYDKAMRDRFDELFGNLWIGKNPTKLKNRYEVLHLDFSRIGGSVDNIEKNFQIYCSRALDAFVYKYKEDYPQNISDEVFATDYYYDKLQIILNWSANANIPMYLIIDEYDNFTNNILNENGEEVYHAITHANGFYRDLFKCFKGNFERIFLTGVSPVTLDDLTSGFNIGMNISTSANFDKMLGFSTNDVREMFSYYQSVGELPKDKDIEEMIEEIKPWYDNYCFSPKCLDDSNRVFNSDMVLYYLYNYISSGEPPKEMVDPNTKTDYNKLLKLISIDKNQGTKDSVLMDVAQKGEIKATISSSFSALEMLTDPDVFPSLLFYYGMLTIKGSYGSQLILGIPNNNVRKQYYGYLQKNYSNRCNINLTKLTSGFNDMALNGEWRETLQYMAEQYATLSSFRDCIEGERNIQGFFLAYLNLNSFYLTAPELELNHGYCDFFLLPDMTHYKSAHSYILEIKYLPKGMHTEDQAKKQWQEAVEQIENYAQAPRVQALRQGTELHKIVMQFTGWEMTRMEEV
ncbi:MAG: ATP-binding protein [Bacteroidales bacterium]|nr:ATP-binding protein [Bacteroidales bacterium]